MFNEQILIEKIRSLNGRDYGACQSLKGEYLFSKKFRLIIHRIPKDPYAPPYTGIYRIQVERDNREIIDFKTLENGIYFVKIICKLSIFTF